MTDVSSAMLTAAVARLLDTPAVVAAVADSADGPAVFAPRADWADVFPRLTIELPQVVRLGRVCGTDIDDVWLTLHCWGKGDTSNLDCGKLAGAVRAALDGDFGPVGFSIRGSDHFEGQKPAGDPDPAIDHLVCTFHYIVQPT